MSKSTKKEQLEKQFETAITEGLISEEVVSTAKKPKGRPRTKSTEGQKPPPSKNMLTAEEKKVENEKKVQAILEGTKKRRLINQIKAFGAYFPHIVQQAANDLVLDELTVDQLERLYACFEDNVLGYSELTSLPITIKKAICKLETGALAVGAANPDHPVLGECLKLEGLSEAIFKDQEIDTNVKLVAVKLAGRLPRNPYLNIVSGIARVAWDVYVENTISGSTHEMDSDPRFSKLITRNKTK